MNLFSLLRPLVVLLFAAGIATLPDRASAEERAYHSRSTALLDLATGDFDAAGKATHLGKYTESGNVSFSGSDPTALEVVGTATLIAANGDELDVAIIGEMDFFAGTITGTIYFVGATTGGHFEDATGSASLVAQVQPNGTIAIVVEGTIDY